MSSILTLAWRNLWRNRRRTLITLASIFITIFLALFMRSMQDSMYTNMISNSVTFSTGYLQIHQNGYWDDKTINNTMRNENELYEKVDSLNVTSLVLPRLESFALGSSGTKTKGIVVIGTDPELEDSLTRLQDKVVKGEYFRSPNDDGALIGEKLAQFLELDVGDTLVMIGQGYHGVSAASIFPVRGIIHYPIPSLNNKLAYLTLPVAQYFYGTGNRITSFTIMIDEPEQLETAVSQVQSLTTDDFEVMSWRELNPQLVQAIQGDNAFAIIMLVILYLIVAFGVFGTMVMMVMERIREFAVLVAVGMQKMKLALMILFETVFLGLLAVITGSAAAFPFLYYLYRNPIPVGEELAKTMSDLGADPYIAFSINPDIFINQGYVTMIIAVLAVIYPITMIYRMKIVSAMRK